MKTSAEIAGRLVDEVQRQEERAGRLVDEIRTREQVADLEQQLADCEDGPDHYQNLVEFIGEQNRVQACHTSKYANLEVELDSLIAHSCDLECQLSSLRW